MNQPEQMMQSWRTNATAWTNAVRDRQIESRRLVTDAAIVTAILQQQPQSVLDVGCGEGWLCRALAESNIQTVGIDASPELIDRFTVTNVSDNSLSRMANPSHIIKN